MVSPPRPPCCDRPHCLLPRPVTIKAEFPNACGTPRTGYFRELKERGARCGITLKLRLPPGAMAACALLAPSIPKRLPWSITAWENTYPTSPACSRTHPDTPSPPTAPRGVSWRCRCLSKGFPSKVGEFIKFHLCSYTHTLLWGEKRAPSRGWAGKAIWGCSFSAPSLKS